MSLNLLDCTLRDGGYYNNWEFKDKLVNSYVSKLRKSKIDVIEIGFRFFSNNSCGKYGSTKEDLIKKLKFNHNQILACDQQC